MAIDKKLLFMIFSSANAVLVSSTLLLQLFGILLIKILKDRRQLESMRNEVVMERNIALRRYRRAKLR